MPKPISINSPRTPPSHPLTPTSTIKRPPREEEDGFIGVSDTLPHPDPYRRTPDLQSEAYRRVSDPPNGDPLGPRLNIRMMDYPNTNHSR